MNKTYNGLTKIELRKIALESIVKGYKKNHPDTKHEDWKIELHFAEYVANLPIVHKSGKDIYKTWGTLAGIYDYYQKGIYMNV